MKKRKHNNPKRILLYTSCGPGTALLEHLVHSGHTVVGICSPPKPSPKQRWVRTYPLLGKHVPGLQGTFAPFTRLEPAHVAEPQVLAELREIPWADPQWMRTAQAEDDIRNLAPDMALVANFPAIIPEALLSLPTCGTYGIFTGAYPEAYGPDSLPHTIDFGLPELDLTLYLVLPQPGSGAPIAKHSVPVGAQDSPERLACKAEQPLLELADQSLLLADGAPPKESLNTPAVIQSRFTPADAVIDWHAPADATVRRIRAVQDKWGGFGSVHGQLFCIQQAIAENSAAGNPAPAGTVVECSSESLCIAVSDGTLRITKLLTPYGQTVSWSKARKSGLLRAQPGEHCEVSAETKKLLNALLKSASPAKDN